MTERWNAWTLLERQRLQTPTQIAVVPVPLCVAPDRRASHLENEVHYLQRVKKKTCGTCGGRDKASAADGDSVSCINLGKTGFSVQDWCNTWDDCMRYYTHWLKRPRGNNPTQTFAVTHIQTVKHVFEWNFDCISVFDGCFYFCFRSILEKEGPRSLFRGLGPNLVGVAPSR